VPTDTRPDPVERSIPGVAVVGPWPPPSRVTASLLVAGKSCTRTGVDRGPIRRSRLIERPVLTGRTGENRTKNDLISTVLYPILDARV
jgi:hypothetical protein